MNKKQEEYFNELWKVKVLKELEKFEDGFSNVTITRNSILDNERTINLIRYGFEEGLKYKNENLHKKPK